MAVAFDGNRGVRRDTVITAVLVALAIVLLVLPAEYQALARNAVRGTVLQPFLISQAEIAEFRVQRVELGEVRAQRDSLVAVTVAQRPLVEENQRLRRLLGLQERASEGLLPAELIRLDEPGAESTFFLTVGTAQGVTPGSVVIGPGGLLGLVRVADEGRAQGIEWTHPEFRVSAMTDDGQAYGLIEPRSGRFREEDMLALVGAPFHSDISAGTRIVTSGRGGVYPRGIPIGTVIGIEEADTGWRKSYVVRPAVRPSSAMQVLVVPAATRPAGEDLGTLWQVAAPPDTVSVDTAGGAEQPGASR